MPQDKPASSKVVVGKTKISFDPKTCTEGHGQFFWSFGSVAVEILGHKDGHCLFRYSHEMEMGATIYHVRVPVDSGMVTIEEGATGISTSFPLDKARIMRHGGAKGYWEVRVGDTDAFVWFGPTRAPSALEPRKGDRVKFRCRVYDGLEFKKRLPNAAADPSVEFVVGAGWPWLETAMEHMTVGDTRQVEVPIKIADDAKKWLPDPNAAKSICVEIRLVSLERAK
ncbi:MAG: hypothetical protein AB7K24_30065 [Gemmataceae bacterium]